jgi:hypothetical protein
LLPFPQRAIANRTKVSTGHSDIHHLLIYQLGPEVGHMPKAVWGLIKSMVYKVTFQRADREIETLYWEGSLEETTSLARSVASECGFEEFRIIESGGSGAEVFSERLPSAKDS